MRRKEVSRRLQSIAEVRTSLAAHRDTISGQLADRPSVRATGVLDYQPVFDHLDHELATVERRLIAADDNHIRQVARVVHLRRQNRERVKKVYDKQTVSRQILASLYGSERSFELAAVSGSTPRVAQTLEEQVDQTVKLLRQPARAKPTEKVSGVQVDFDVLAGDLASELNRLQTSREAYRRARKVVDGTRVVTQAAIAEVDNVFPWVAGSLENTFRLAGERELADRIRTSTRRVTRRLTQSQEESEPTETSSEDSVPLEAAPLAEADAVGEAETEALVGS